MTLANGLYRVQFDRCRGGVVDRVTAGFLVSDGRIVDCAPILRRSLATWVEIAERLGP